MLYNFFNILKRPAIYAAHFTYKHFYKCMAALLAVVILISYITPAKVSADDNDDTFTWPSGPSVYADAAIVMEATTGLILYEKDIYSAYYPASITKILTTLLALENCGLSETVTMSHEAEWDVDFNSSRIGMVEGEQFSLEDALYAVMLESANEVSYAVGEHVANGPISEFSRMMNERAAELGCVNSNFVNPNGLHDDNHYTCAYDMALISRAAIAIPEFRVITGSRTHQIPPTNKNVLRYLANHHRFIRKTLTYDGAIGGKTGGTDEAKTTLVTFAERDGLLLIAVVLHVDTALHAYEDTAKILDFGFENYSLYSIKQTELTEDFSFPSLFNEVPQFKSSSDTLISIGNNSNVVLPKTASFSDAKKSIVLTPVEEFVHGNNVIGQISYEFAGKYVGAADIIYYNPDFPVTSSEFKEKWPSFLLMPDNLKSDIITTNNSIISSLTGTSENQNAGSTASDASQSGNDTKEHPLFFRVILPVTIGIVVAFIVLVAQIYIFFIIPKRKNSGHRKF